MAAVAITGAPGIGLELARQFARRGDAVVGICRRSSKELDEVASEVVDGVDVATTEGASTLAERLRGRSIDVLVNNAGILRRSSLDSLDWEGMREQFEVNALGPLRVTAALLPSLAPHAKVAMITSRMGSIADNGSGGQYGYRMSKAALNMAAVSLARDLSGRGIAVAILHPGMVATDMTGRHGIPVEQSARGLIARIDALTVDDSGTFWHANGEILPW